MLYHVIPTFHGIFRGSHDVHVKRLLDQGHIHPQHLKPAAGRDCSILQGREPARSRTRRSETHPKFFGRTWKNYISRETTPLLKKGTAPNLPTCPGPRLAEHASAPLTSKPPTAMRFRSQTRCCSKVCSGATINTPRTQ